MSRRPTLLVAAALTAAAVLSMSACGSGGADSKVNDKIAGADTSGEASPSPVQTASTASDRPKIEVPSDVTYDFEWKTTGDAGKDALLSDVEQRIKAVDMAIADQNALDRAYLFYTEGTAAAGTQRYIQQYIDHEARTTGLTRFYDENLTIDGDGTASLVYCGDQSKAFNKYLKTGKTDVTPVTKNSYVIYASALRRNKKNGVWVTERMTSQRGSSNCQP